MRVKPVRNIADWGERRVRKFPADLVEPPDWCVDMPEVWEKIRDPEPHEVKSSDVVYEVVV